MLPCSEQHVSSAQKLLRLASAGGLFEAARKARAQPRVMPFSGTSVHNVHALSTAGGVNGCDYCSALEATFQHNLPCKSSGQNLRVCKDMYILGMSVD